MRNSLSKAAVQFFAGCLIFCPLYLYSDGCADLDPNSEPYMDDGHVVHCRCKEGYAKWEGHCRLVEEVRTRLEERLKKAQAGGRAALYAWSQESVAGAAEILTAFDLLSVAKGADFEKQLLKFEGSLTGFLYKMGDCSFKDPDLKTSCQNIKTFQRLVQETRLELAKLPPRKKTD